MDALTNRTSLLAVRTGDAAVNHCLSDVSERPTQKGDVQVGLAHRALRPMPICAWYASTKRGYPLATNRLTSLRGLPLGSLHTLYLCILFDSQKAEMK